jgi:gamma-glutamyltranspeptidase / glutathione hydrolase
MLRNKLLKISFVSLSAFLFVSLYSCSQKTPKSEAIGSQLFPNGKNQEGRAPKSFVATGTKAMVVTEGEKVTEIGMEVLKKGGNAIDSAIAVSFALSSYRPQSTGIGGGGFFLIYVKKENKFIFLDARERAPKFLDLKKYQDPMSSRIGGLSIATPGLVAGLDELYLKYSSKQITWKDLVEPSIEISKLGFPVYPHLAYTIEIAQKNGVITEQSELKKLLTSANGKILKVGNIYRNLALAKTLQTIATEGADVFYKGKIAKDITKTVKKNRGILNAEDLKNYQIKYRTPLQGTYRNFQIVSSPLPSSGGILLIEMLNMLEQFPLAQFQWNDAKTIALKADVMNLAFKDRALYLGDSDFVKAPVAKLISKTYAKRILNIPSQKDFFNTENFPTNGSTTHFSIIDQEGNIVSSTQSINHYFGSGIVTENSGIILNNHINDFSFGLDQPNAFKLVGKEANSIEPEKTPLSSMSPTIVLRNGKPVIILGSPGGPRIITAVFSVILNYIDHNMSPAESVNAPRIHQQWKPEKLFVEENGFSVETLQKLSQLGWSTETVNDGIGNVSAIFIENKKIIGISDPRREGKPLGN